MIKPIDTAEIEDYETSTHDDIVEFVRGWYGNWLPPIGSPSFRRFATHSHTLVTAICEGRVKIQVDYDAPAAWVDLVQRIINLPLFYFDSKRVAELAGRKTDLSELAVAMINGSVIHEALHLKKTPQDPLNSMKAAGLVDAVAKYGSLLFHVNNIVEDIYIEAELNPEGIGGFVYAKNAIILSASRFEREIEAAEIAKVAVSSPDLSVVSTEWSATSFSGMLTFLKNQELRLHPVWDETELRREVRALAISAETVTAPLDRPCLAVKICDLLVHLLTDQEQRKFAEEGRRILKGDADPRIHANASIIEVSTSAEASIAMSMPKSEEKLALILTEEFEEASDGEKMPTSIMKLEKAAIFESVQKASRKHFPADFEGPRPPKMRGDFGRTLRILKTKNHVPGEPRNRGAKLQITRIYRIATDNKMFTSLNQFLPQPNVEVQILVDASGSMGSRYGRSLWAAFDVFEALKSAGIACEIHAHSGVPNSPKIPYIFRVVSHGFGRNTANNEYWLRRSISFLRNQNYDGVAIKHVAGLFSKRPARRLLIVISDGEPAGHGYGGDDAKNHTKRAIENARKGGVSVICFSIDHGVVEPNNRLYGKSSNVNCVAGVEGEFRRVISSLFEE